MDEDIDDNPINKIPNPTAISAFCVIFCLLENVMMKAPIPKINGAKKSGFNAPAHSLADTSHAVIVVPTLAPMITPAACVRFMIPAFTKPTTITVVADEL